MGSVRRQGDWSVKSMLVGLCTRSGLNTRLHNITGSDPSQFGGVGHRLLRWRSDESSPGDAGDPVRCRLVSGHLV